MRRKDEISDGACSISKIAPAIDKLPQEVSRRIDEFSPTHVQSAKGDGKTAPVKFQMLDGLRVLTTIYIIAFHTLWYNTFYISDKRYVEIASIPSLRPIAMGINGVDVFFIITGIVLAYPVFTKEKIDHWGDYVWNRISRLYPSMLAVTAFLLLTLFNNGWEYVFNLPSDPEKSSFWFLAPFTLTFLSNLIPLGGFMGWTWSISVQVHFYLIFPWLITKYGTGKKLLKVILAGMAISVPFRYLIPKMLISTWGLPEFMSCSLDKIVRFSFFFNIYYSPTYFRIFSIFTGVLVSWVLVNKQDWVKTVQSSLLYQVLLVIVAIPGIYGSYLPFDEHSWKYILFYPGGYLWLLSLAILFFLLLTHQKIVAPLNYFLSLPVFARIAPATYGAYLVHCGFVARFIQWGVNPPFDTTYSHVALFSYIAKNVVLSFIVGFFVEKYVERPGVAWLKTLDKGDEANTTGTQDDFIAKIIAKVYKVRIFFRSHDAQRAEVETRRILAKCPLLSWIANEKNRE